MNEADIPIDIHTLKLQDWLVSRRIVPKNIQPYIKDIRSKISNALQDMPSNDKLIALLSGAQINYYHCKEIVEILKQTEKDTKNLFGSYSSKRMKDWQEIIRLYEKENIYLAETAQIFVRNINFEIPGVKKQIARLQQQSDDALDRIAALTKQEKNALKEHEAILTKLGIKGINLREEFTEALQKLPEIYTHSIRDIGTLKEAVDYYTEFTNDENCLPIIRHVIQFGNTTVYHYVHKEAPLVVEENPIVLNLPEEENAVAVADNEIDFGADDNGDSSTISGEMIDFGDLQIDTPAESSGDIDWGIESTPAEDKEIDYDIPIEEYDIVIEGVGVDGGTAKGDEAYTLLDSPNYREEFINEIYELQAFVKRRLIELKANDPVCSILYADCLSTHDVTSTSRIVKRVDAFLAEVENENTRNLIQLKHSAKYAEILASKLKQKLKAIDKIRENKELLRVKSEELKKQSVELKPVQERLIEQTKILQDKIEADISKRYKNRVVNLMGGLKHV